MKALPLVLLSLCFSMNTAVAEENWNDKLPALYFEMPQEMRQAFVEGLTIGYETGLADGYAIRDEGKGDIDNFRKLLERSKKLRWKDTKEIMDWCKVEYNAPLLSDSEILQEIANGGTKNDLKRRLLDKQDSKEKALDNPAK